jgi:hypothetical protein
MGLEKSAKPQYLHGHVAICAVADFQISDQVSLLQKFAEEI